MKSALLMIDVQHGLTSGKFEAVNARATIARINAVAAKARAAGALVVLIQHETQTGLLARGSEGWAFAPDLIVDAGDAVVAKRATDSFHQTSLQSLLESHNVTSLVVCGFQSEFCVDTTTRRAMALGYPVTLVADGHSTCDSEVLSAAQISAHHNSTLANISSFGPRTTATPAAAITFASR